MRHDLYNDSEGEGASHNKNNQDRINYTCNDTCNEMIQAIAAIRRSIDSYVEEDTCRITCAESLDIDPRLLLPTSLVSLV